MKQDTPLVTIVTVTFNLIKTGREEFFRQNLESVHNQTYENVEHIIIDGDSKDGTADLIKEYSDRGWIKYLSEPDKGIYDAMNKGIKMAKGKYIAFLNSDDYWHDANGIKNSVERLESSCADFSYAPARIEKEDGSIYEGEHDHCSPKISKAFFSMPFCHQTMFTKRSVFLKEGMFDLDFKSAGDYDFLLRICLNKYKSVFVDSEFTTFRLGGLSSIDQEKSLREVSMAYFKNFNKLIDISKKECDSIFCNEFNGISRELADQLKNHAPYFNFNEYEGSRSIVNKLRALPRIFIRKIAFLVVLVMPTGIIRWGNVKRSLAYLKKFKIR